MNLFKYVNRNKISTLGTISKTIAVLYLISLFDMSIDTWKLIQLSAAILTGLLFIVTGLATYKISQLEGKISAVYGVLTPSNNFYKDIQNSSTDILWIDFGNNLIGHSINDGDKEITPIADLPFKFTISKKGISFNGELRSFSGDIVAKITNNEWEINPNNYFRRNYDEHAVEIIDSKGLTKIQIEFEYKNLMVVKGFFRNEKGLIVFATELGTSIKTPNNMENPQIISDLLPLIFKYPSEKYLGVRAHLPNQ